MNIYFYPYTTKINTVTLNPYVLNFIDALNKYHTVINYKDPSSIGIFKIMKYFKKVDVLVLNWIEGIPDNKGGFAQSIFFFFLVYAFRFTNKKIVWIMHNKLSHHPRHLMMKKALFRLLLFRSDLIITHAREGVEFARALTGIDRLPVRYFPHPIIPVEVIATKEKDNDILIWGSVAPYKGIDKFLQYLYDHHLEKQFNIKVAGKIVGEDYKKTLMNLQNDHIQIEDLFVKRDHLHEMIQRSKIVLFTYSSESILCSGALIYSLSLRANVIGPHMGNFKDIRELGLIHTFTDYNELIELIKDQLHASAVILQPQYDAYFNESSWDNFIVSINNWLADDK